LKREVEAAVENLPRAYKAGVTLISGSESGWSPIPHGQWHGRELPTFVELFGLTASRDNIRENKVYGDIRGSTFSSLLACRN
jgi:hypothetical protein